MMDLFKKYEVMCTWNELKEMQNEGVFDIQSHGYSHEIPEFIKTRDYHNVEDDIRLSKFLLLKNLNKESTHFAWPKGVYSETSVQMATKLGFKALYTTQRGANTYDLLNVKMLVVKCKGSRWLRTKLKIYSSLLLSRIYSKIRL